MEEPGGLGEQELVGRTLLLIDNRSGLRLGFIWGGFGFFVVVWFGLLWFFGCCLVWLGLVFLTVSLFSSGRLGTNEPPTSALRVVGTLDALHHGRLEMYLSQV